MQKIAYILPGYGESRETKKGYDKIGELFLARGIRPVHIKIGWHSKKTNSFKNYIEEFLKQYKKPKGAEIYVLGFSYGAMIAFLTESKTHPKALILCSLSPYFKEDLGKLKPSWLKWWRKNFKDSDYSFNELAPKIKTKTFLIAGDKEGPEIARRIHSARTRIKKSSITIARGANHNVSLKKYLRTIEVVIRQIDNKGKHFFSIY